MEWVLDPPAALLIASAALLGLLVGSFLNVVILRLPERMDWRWRRDSRELLGMDASATEAPEPPDIVFKRSHCPKCGQQLSAWENIPLISYLALRGRCRHYGTAISIQYPAVELLTGIAFALVVWQFGATLQALSALIFTGILIAAAGIDWRTTLLPDDLTLPLLWLGLAATLVPIFVDPQAAILGAIAGYMSLWLVFWAFKLLTGKEGMGYGDFKLLAALGAWCGIGGILPILLLSSLVGALLGTMAILIQGRDRAQPIPFGPYLAVAGWIQLVWGEQLVKAYSDFAGLS